MMNWWGGLSINQPLIKERAEEWKEELTAGPSVTKQASVLGHKQGKVRYTAPSAIGIIPLGSVDSAEKALRR